MHHVHTFGDRDRDIDDPTRTPPNPSAAVAVLLLLQDRNFSSSVAKERLSNSFAFDSFVTKQASVGESKKRKKKPRLIFRGGGGGEGFVRNLRTMLCTPLVQDEGHTTPVSSRSSTSSTCTCTYVSCDVLLPARRRLTCKRRVVSKPNFGSQLYLFIYLFIEHICLKRIGQ